MKDSIHRLSGRRIGQFDLTLLSGGSIDIWNFRFRFGRVGKSRRDRFRDGVRCRANWIRLQMGIAGCGLNLGVAEEPTDHCQILSKLECVRREGMAQVMNSQSVEPCTLP